MLCPKLKILIFLCNDRFLLSTERTASSRQAGPWTVRCAAYPLGWLMASLLPCQPAAVKVTELQDGPAQGEPEAPILGLQGHFVRGTDKTLSSSWWEVDRVCVHVHVCILNLAWDTVKAPNISISVSDSRTPQVLSTRGRLSLYSTHQQNSKKKLIEGEYEDFWHWRCIKRRLTEEEGFLLQQQVKTESVQERKSHTETLYFITKTVNLVYFLHVKVKSVQNLQ